MQEPRLDLLSRAKSRMSQVIGIVPHTFLLVDVSGQTLFRIVDNAVARQYPISTAKNGVGNRSGSLQTPCGLHRIRERYGHNAPAGRIFRDREDTGDNVNPGSNEDNLILSRILRLEGMEEGLNKGGEIDSFERYIYIHGTNNEHRIGQQNSHGCICMRNADVIELFEMAGEGTLVFIG